MGEVDAWLGRKATYSLKSKVPDSALYFVSTAEFKKLLEAVDPEKINFSKYCTQADQRLANKLAFALKKHFEIKTSHHVEQQGFKSSKVQQLIKQKRFSHNLTQFSQSTRPVLQTQVIRELKGTPVEPKTETKNPMISKLTTQRMLLIKQKRESTPQIEFKGILKQVSQEPVIPSRNKEVTT